MAFNFAIGESWDAFFVPLKDDTTYTGSTANVVPANTSEIAVPTAFLADTTTGRKKGQIWRLLYRDWDGSSASPVPAPWSEISLGVGIDNLDFSSAKIRSPTLTTPCSS
jgi:hypothetical protein